MSETFPDRVYPGRSVYHKVYGSHDGGYDPTDERWRYWTVCDGGPKHRGYPVSVNKMALSTVDQARRAGLRPCTRCGFAALEGDTDE